MRVLITGISGQAGSYLAEYYVEKGWEVHGFVRQRSDLSFLNSVIGRISLHIQDITDPHGVISAVRQIKPEVIHHLAAMTFVPYSWNNPLGTFQDNVNGTINVLEAARVVEPTPIVQFAGSSEEYGIVKQSDTPVVETLQVRPGSPYGISKYTSDLLFQQYFHSHGMPTVITRAFNHECVTADTPVITDNWGTGLVEICPIEELVPHREDPGKGKRYSTIIDINPASLHVWDGGSSWTPVKTLSALWNRSRAPSDRHVISVCARGGMYEATSDHISFLDGSIPVRTKELVVGQRLEMKPFPALTESVSVTNEEAELLGLMVSEGHIEPDGKSRLTCLEPKIRDRAAELWKEVSGGTSREGETVSGFTGKPVGTVEFLDGRDYSRYIMGQIYTEKRHKRVPLRILNAGREAITSFLEGYNSGDGLKAGNQKTKFKSFTTESSTLAAGLVYLVSSLGFRFTLHPETKPTGKTYHHININSLHESKYSKNSGYHLRKDLKEIKVLRPMHYDGWLFDLETLTGRFSAGIGNTWVHNSPRRGKQFISTEIVTQGLRIKAKQQGCFVLGNLESVRDFSDARDIVEAYYISVTNRGVRFGETYNVCSGRGYRIGDVVKIVARMLEIPETVKQDPARMRPSDLPVLVGDPTKFRKATGWRPKYTFEDTLEWMIRELAPK